MTTTDKNKIVIPMLGPIIALATIVWIFLLGGWFGEHINQDLIIKTGIVEATLLLIGLMPCNIGIGKLSLGQQHDWENCRYVCEKQMSVHFLMKCSRCGYVTEDLYPV